ncbi:MAG TPA: hypothetical protein VII63_11110 [Caulobacteraceae bacterium]
MSLSDLASIGSFVSGLGVLVSLIYLSLQIRQNTHAHRAMAHQDRLNFVKEFLGRLTEASMASVFLRGSAGDDQLTEVEITQYRSLMHGWFLGMAEIVWLHERGVLDSDRFAGSMAALRLHLRSPGCRAVWRVIKPLMPTPFRALVEKTIADLPIGEPHSVSRDWRSALANQDVPA